MQNEANFAEKKVKILILDYFFEFECLNMLDITDYDSTNGSELLHNHSLLVPLAIRYVYYQSMQLIAGPH